MTFDLFLSRIQKAALILMYGAIAFAAIMIGTVAFEVNGLKVNDAVDNVGKAATSLNTSLGTLNTDIGKADPKDEECAKTGCRTALQEIFDNFAGISRMAYKDTKAQQDYWDKFPATSDRILGKFEGIADKLDKGVDGLDIPRIGTDVHTTFGDLHTTFLKINGDCDITDMATADVATQINAWLGVPCSPGPIKNAATLLATLNAMGVDIDQEIIKDPAVKNLLTQAVGIASQLNLTSEDIRKILDKVQHDYTAPRTKKGWALLILKSLIEFGDKVAEIKLYLSK